MDERHELLEGGLVAITPRKQQFRHALSHRCEAASVVATVLFTQCKVWMPFHAYRGEREVKHSIGIKPGQSGTRTHRQRSASYDIHQALGEVINSAAGLLLYDEELPREGVHETRIRRLSRWIDGSTWVWTAHRTQIGRGEGSSGLRFDRLIGPDGDETVARMSDVFISYSRRDVWVDWEDIPPSAEWWADVERAIEASDTFVFVISPASAASSTCEDECRVAFEASKRIVPVVLHDTPAQAVPEPVRKVNWLLFRSSDDFDVAYQQLVKTIAADLEWVQAHTRLLQRAREWETHQRDHSYLPGGADLEESERRLAQSVGREPRLNQIQMDYIAAGRARETQRLRGQLRGFYHVSLMYGLLQLGLFYLMADQAIAAEAIVTLSPIWVLSIVFGGFGLTFGRYSLRKSVIATILAGVLLFALIGGGGIGP